MPPLLNCGGWPRRITLEKKKKSSAGVEFANRFDSPAMTPRPDQETQTYRGACHCGRVTFEVLDKLDYVVDCNCSSCRRKGALWHPAAEADLRILSGEADLVLYQFNTRTAKHYFCKHCGIHPFIRPRLD